MERERSRLAVGIKVTQRLGDRAESDLLPGNLPFAEQPDFQGFLAGGEIAVEKTGAVEDVDLVHVRHRQKREHLAQLDARLCLFQRFPQRGLRGGLAELKAMKLRLAILSNGSPAMLRPLTSNAGLRGLIGAVISVDQRKIYKPSPAVYRLAVERLRTPKTAMGFVSSNCWDACGAKSFGFRTFWINRTGAPVDELGAMPDHVIGSLGELPALIRRPLS